MTSSRECDAQRVRPVGRPADRHSQAFLDALDAVPKSRDGLISHNVHIIGKRRTTFRFDRLTWKALLDVARREAITLHELCTAIDAEKPRGLNLTVAIRAAVLQYYVDAATEAGHAKARHGKALHKKPAAP
jgi:predicted DNA-binding ribbon-helix-helix protein